MLLYCDNNERTTTGSTVMEMATDVNHDERAKSYSSVLVGRASVGGKF
jgi:hypothetical protein